jgi:SAM-dependent methyltransferase
MQRTPLYRSKVAPVDPQARHAAAQRLAETLRTGGCPADRTFDRFLPEPLRLVSREYWTPLAAAKRAAQWLDELGIATVVDIGSGAGKFCIAGALFGKSRFIGLEQYSWLVTAARALADQFDLSERVVFVNGALGAVPTPVGDAYYLFNPFAEYVFSSGEPGAAEVTFSEEQRERDVAAAQQLLWDASEGTVVLTYNGFGGRMPGNYELVRIDRELRGVLRLWRKKATRARVHPATNGRLSRRGGPDSKAAQ